MLYSSNCLKCASFLDKVHGSGTFSVGKDQHLCYSVPLALKLRVLVVPGITFLILSYLIQAIGCILCSLSLVNFVK